MSGLGARQKRRVGLILCAKKRKKNALNIKLEIQISDIMYRQRDMSPEFTVTGVTIVTL